jgi:hypothetical protein
MDKSDRSTGRAREIWGKGAEADPSPQMPDFRYTCAESETSQRNEQQKQQCGARQVTHRACVCVCVCVCDHDKLGCHGNLIVPIGGLGYDQIFQALDAFFNRGLVAEGLSHGIIGVKSALLRQHAV